MQMSPPQVPRAWFMAVGLCCGLIAASCSRRQDAVVAFTGSTLGHLEPCGCSTRETGGLPRRHSYLRQLSRECQSVLLLDNGDLAGGTTLQERIKMEHLVAGLDQMGYTAVNVGERDVAFGVDVLRSLAETVDVALLSANLVPAGGDTHNWPCQPYVIRKMRIGGGALRIAVTGVMSKRLAAAVAKAEPLARVEDPVRVLGRLVPTIREEADLVILLARMSAREATDLASRVTGLDVVICGEERDIPARISMPAAVGPRVFETGKSGRYVGTLPLRIDESGKVAAGQFALEIIDDAFPRSPAMSKLILEYRTVVRDMDLLRQQGTLAAGPPGGAYIGNYACGGCHEQDLSIWRRTRHAHAYSTLARLHEN